MAINEIDENKPDAPNDLTEVASSSPAAPTDLTELAESSPAAPIDLTEVAESTPAAPTDLTEVAESTPSAPVNLTEVAESTPSAPVNLTEVSATVLNRVLTPSIDLDFGGDSYSLRGSPKTFAETFTYSRASSATFINRRIDQQGRYEYFLDTDYVGTVENLLTWSQVFTDADWTKTRSSLSGNRLIENGDNNTHFMNQSYTTTASTDYTLYFDLKAGERIQARIRNQSLTNVYILVDLESGAILEQSNCIGYSEYRGDGVFRFAITFDSGAGGAQLMSLELAEGGTNSYQGDGSSGIYVYRSQLTESAKPLTYVLSTSIAASQVFSESLRRGWDLQGNCLAALFERGSTNLFVYSENLSNPAWTKQNSTLGGSQIKAPDGTFSAYKLIPDSAANGYLDQTTSFTSGQSYTCSVFAKAGEFSQVRILAQAGWAGSTSSTEFDLSTGEILSQQTDGASIEYLWDGWYRISATHEATVTGNSSWQVCRSTDSGDGSSGYYVWASQNENTPYPTSYIMTEGSTATRSSDDLTLISYSSHPRIETGQELSFFAECRTLSSNTSSDDRAVFSTSTTGGRFNLLRIDSSVQFYNYYRAGASDSFSTGTNIDEYKRLSGSVSKSDFVSLYENGILTDTNTKSPNFQGALSQFFIGRYTSTGHLDGYIKRIAIYDVELTAQEVSLL